MTLRLNTFLLSAKHDENILERTGQTIFNVPVCLEIDGEIMRERQFLLDILHMVILLIIHQLDLNQ